MQIVGTAIESYIYIMFIKRFVSSMIKQVGDKVLISN